jgi:hypothetical protein
LVVSVATASIPSLTGTREEMIAYEVRPRKDRRGVDLQTIVMGALVEGFDQ